MYGQVCVRVCVCQYPNFQHSSKGKDIFFLCRRRTFRNFLFDLLLTVIRGGGMLGSGGGGYCWYLVFGIVGIGYCRYWVMGIAGIQCGNCWYPALVLQVSGVTAVRALLVSGVGIR